MKKKGQQQEFVMTPEWLTESQRRPQQQEQKQQSDMSVEIELLEAKKSLHALLSSRGNHERRLKGLRATITSLEQKLRAQNDR